MLSGETGAGKSILVDALQLALGSRGDAGVVREGAARAEISAEFDVPPALAPWLADAGFDADAGDAGRMLLRRTIDAQGKSRAWINGSGATIAQLREAADQLVDIHGQHAWQGLTRAPAVRALLDAYAQIDAAPLAARWSNGARRRRRSPPRATSKATSSASASGSPGRSARSPSSRPAPTSGPSSTPSTPASRTASRCSTPRASRSTRSPRPTRAPIRSPAAPSTRCRTSPRSMPASKARSKRSQGAQAQLQDAAHTLAGYLDRAELDPERLREVEERLSAWVTLARRHRRPPADLPALLAQWQAELRELDAAADLDALQRASDAARAAYDGEARRVSAARRAAAPKFAAAVTRTMQQLGMAGGRFEVELVATDAPQSFGLEAAEFLVAGHAGTTPRPLAKVASGGELSRIALAVAVVGTELQGGGEAPGNADLRRGRRRHRRRRRRDRRPPHEAARPRAPGARRHPPAAGGGVRRSPLRRQQARERRQRRRARSKPVAGEARVAEIARMLGGEKLSSTSLAHAQEMLASGAERVPPAPEKPHRDPTR